MRWLKADTIKFLVLLIVALGAGPAGAAYWQWSTTAASNATADPTINWSEGMSPSSVNDSARAMMSAEAAWRNDVTAVSATTGTSTAYVLTSNQGGFSAVTTRDGFMIGFIPNVTNAAGPVTINVDGAGAKPLRTRTAAAMPAGVIIAGSKYQASYKFSTDEWLLLNNYSTLFEVPLGTLLPYTGDAAPNANFILPVGSCISRTTYATYFALVGTRFGVCDGVTTFGTPDLRGRFIGGSDEMGGVAAGRITITGCVSNFFNVVGLTCGAQSYFPIRAQLPSFAGSADFSATQPLVYTGSSIGYAAGANVAFRPDLFGASTVPVTVNAGTQVVTPLMNPSMAINFILRIL